MMQKSCTYIPNSDKNKFIFPIQIRINFFSILTFCALKNKPCPISQIIITLIKVNENGKIDKYLDLTRKLKKLWNMTLTMILKNLEKTEGIGNQKKNQDYSIFENDQNTQKIPEDLRRLDVTQSPVKDHQLSLLRKNGKE